MSDDELAGIDDDGELDDELEPDEPTSRGGNDELEGGHACPECGRKFKRASSLGLHRFRSHGIQGARRTGGQTDQAPRGRSAGGGGQSSGKRSSRQRLVRETLIEILDTRRALVEGIDTDTLDVSDTIRRDADLIAAALAGLADRVAIVGVAIDRLLGAGGVFSFVRAFAPTLRKVIARRGVAHAEQQALEQEYARIAAEQGEEAARAWAASQGLTVA